MKVKTDSLLFKLSLLSISTLLMLAPAIAPAIPLMAEQFSTQSQSSIELLLTVPNFGIILALFISPLCIKIFGKKVTVIIGLTLALLTGILPIVTSSFQLIFLARFLFGFGIGLFNSLAVSLLSEFYEGDALSSMIGFQTVAGSIGAAFAAFSVGFFITKGWQASFAIYFLILPALILFTLFVPIKETKIQEEKEEIKEKQTINKDVIYLTLLVFGLFVFYMVIPIKLPELVMTRNLGSMSSVSIITGISTLVGIPIGILYGKIYKKLQNRVLPIGLLLLALGLLTVVSAPNLILVAIGVMISGIGFGVSMPFIYTKVALVAPKNSINLAYTFILISTNIGVFTSPLILNFLGKVFNLESAQGSMILAIIGFSLLLLIVLMFSLKNKKIEILTNE